MTGQIPRRIPTLAALVVVATLASGCTGPEFLDWVDATEYAEDDAAAAQQKATTDGTTFKRPATAMPEGRGGGC